MGSVDSTTVARGGGVPMPLAGSVFAGTRARIIAGVAVLVLVSAGIVATRVSATPPAAPLRTAPVTRGTVTQTVQVSGSINPATETRLSFDVAGRLAQTLVSVGQAVTAGQPLAQLDTSDLQIAVAQAQANLATAQANYDRTVAGATPQDIAIAKNAVAAAQQNLQQAQTSTQNDMASAQQALTALQNSYGAAKTAFNSTTEAASSDVGTYQQGITPLGTQVLGVRGTLDQNIRPGDVTTARNALVSAEVALSTANSSATQALLPALNDYGNAAGMVQASVTLFDQWLAQGRDTTDAVAQFQAAQTAFQSASARLSAAVDGVAAQVTLAQQDVTTAQTALNTSSARADPTLDQPRLDVNSILANIANEQQTGTVVKNDLSQASAALQGISSPISGSYVSAQQAVQSAQAKAQQSVTSQGQAVTSAQLNFNKTVATPQQYDIAQALASVQLQRAALEKAQNDVASATLTAPSAGVVSAINFQPGEYVPAGGTANPFIVLSNTSTIALHGTVGEADIAKLKLGQVATVSVDALGTGSRLTGKVTSLDPVATIQQGVPVYGVDVTIDVPDPSVRPGMTGTANVIIASKQGVLVVPNLAIKSQNGQRYVQVLRNGKVENVDATFGISNDSMTEVTSGLQQGDQVVLPGLRPGASGRPTNGGFGGGRGPVIVGPGRGG